jgi:hypothetical protein
VSIYGVFQIILSNWKIEQLGFKSTYSTHALELGVLIVLHKKYSFAPRIILSKSLMYFFQIPHQGTSFVFFCFLAHPTSKKLYLDFVGMDDGDAHLCCVCC